MEEPPVVRKLRVEVVAGATTGAQIVERNALDVRHELWVQYLIDAAAMLVQDVAFRLCGEGNSGNGFGC